MITCLVPAPFRPRQVTAWAKEMLNPRTAVVLDTETADLHGAIVEVAVVDACTKDVLLTTLVQPGCPIEPDAQRVHGISDDIVADAPLFRDILPDLLRVTAGRTLLAYNAAYDHAILVEQGLRSAVDIEHLAEPCRWACIMQARSDCLGRPDHRYPLRGAHRALGDALAAQDLLELIASGTLLECSRCAATLEDLAGHPVDDRPDAMIVLVECGLRPAAAGGFLCEECRRQREHEHDMFPPPRRATVTDPTLRLAPQPRTE